MMALVSFFYDGFQKGVWKGKAVESTILGFGFAIWIWLAACVFELKV